MATPGYGQGRDVDAVQATVALGPQAVRRLRDADPHLAQLPQEHVHVVGPGVDHHHVTAGQADGGQEGGGHHPVRDHPVAGGVKLLDPLDLDASTSRLR